MRWRVDKVTAMMVMIAVLPTGCMLDRSEFAPHVFTIVDAVTTGVPGDTYSMLTESARAEIDKEAFNGAIASKDFGAVVRLFRDAGINVRRNSFDGELGALVPKVNGGEGYVTFVMQREDKEWRVANVLIAEQQPGKGDPR